MPASHKLTTSKVAELTKKMRELPSLEPVKALSTAKAVKSMNRDISALRKRGYTYAAIRDFLAGEGVEIKETTLRTYMVNAKRKSTKIIGQEGAPRQSIDVAPIRPSIAKVPIGFKNVHAKIEAR